MTGRSAVLASVACLVACGGSGGTTGPGPDPGPEPDAPAPDRVIMVDEAHHNLHTATGRYAPFVDLIEGAGFTVIRSATPLRRDSLERGDLLVVANALHASDADGSWSLPTRPAFTAEEVAAVRRWVEDGGALLLIADHMPFPGAAANLAAAFGIGFVNGFAFDTDQLDEPRACLGPDEIHRFQRARGTLRDHAVTRGRNADERVETVATFTGHAFDPGSATAVMVFEEGAVSLQPERAWVFDADTPRIDATGLAQGAVLEVGAGRIAVFGEAAMFTEQTCGPNRPMGFNAPQARENARFALNVVRWLLGAFAP